jgi:hypothetical protein
VWEEGGGGDTDRGLKRQSGFYYWKVEGDTGGGGGMKIVKGVIIRIMCEGGASLGGVES